MLPNTIFHIWSESTFLIGIISSSSHSCGNRCPPMCSTSVRSNFSVHCSFSCMLVSKVAVPVQVHVRKPRRLCERASRRAAQNVRWEDCKTEIYFFQKQPTWLTSQTMLLLKSWKQLIKFSKPLSQYQLCLLQQSNIN